MRPQGSPCQEAWARACAFPHLAAPAVEKETPWPAGSQHQEGESPLSVRLGAQAPLMTCWGWGWGRGELSSSNGPVVTGAEDLVPAKAIYVQYLLCLFLQGQPCVVGRRESQNRGGQAGLRERKAFTCSSRTVFCPLVTSLSRTSSSGVKLQPSELRVAASPIWSHGEPGR